MDLIHSANASSPRPAQAWLIVALLNMVPLLCFVTDPGYRATGSGFLNAFATIIGGLAIHARGALRDCHLSISSVFEFASASLVVCAILIIVLKSRPKAAVP